ncbi:MAG: ABC transporter permease [Candidatus Omnitrophica bacterium]|nr:hypothetical protein [bacterium]NUN97620.1 ABC transporter permease [Candidatus Omnitrophota bacterium]
MKLSTLVGRELFERRHQLLTGFLAIFLGIAVVVSIQHVSHFSEMAVARQLDQLGANILILPKSASLKDYYSADMQSEVMPEEYVTAIALSDVEGVNNLSPKLSVPVRIGEREFTLTGILPKSEFQAKAAWQGAGVFSRATGHVCAADLPGYVKPSGDEILVRRRVVEILGESEALLGAEAAALLGIESGGVLELLGKSFSVSAVLPQTGTVDDTRIFAHLHTVQDLTGKGPALNAIEIVGCCQQITTGMVRKLNALLPEAKVVTISQVVDTQVKTNAMMANLSVLFMVIIVLVGGAGIANYMYANVFERRREIGTLMALGAGSGMVLRIFLLKAALLGVAGGIGGYMAGTALAVALGPHLAGVTVLPLPLLLFWAVLLSTAISLVASYFPARRAARLDPCASLQEV